MRACVAACVIDARMVHVSADLHVARGESNRKEDRKYSCDNYTVYCTNSSAARGMLGGGVSSAEFSILNIEYLQKKNLMIPVLNLHFYIAEWYQYLKLLGSREASTVGIQNSNILLGGFHVERGR